MASTYVNNLRLNEMATGDGAGTWGTTTNLNLELIGQALGWGTRAIANASTDNITIADGASDADRSMALKLTGGGQACTVTILPNTSSKVWIMENATAATLTFTQGSGANVAILAGETKIIATDGGGSGAVVYDLLTDVNLAGTTKTAALVNAGTLTSTGKITSDAGIDIDNFNIDGTTIALSSGDMTLDSAGDIILDADGADITFKDGGTEIAHLSNSSSDFQIEVATQDKDILFKGNDGGSGITALQLDMSEAGAASFSGNVNLLDSQKLQIGNGADLKITFDGTNGDFETAGNLTFDVAGTIELNADSGSVNLADASTTYAELVNSSSDFVIKSSQNDKDIIFKGVDNSSLITALTLDMSAAGAATFNNDVTAFSDARLKSNITTIPDALSKVNEMRGVHYVRDETGKDSTGVIAQELQKIAPELVLTAEDENGTLSVNYGNITGYLIEAIKELSARVKELEGK